MDAAGGDVKRVEEDSVNNGGAVPHWLTSLLFAHLPLFVCNFFAIATLFCKVSYS
jgi:hypothetical protein